jgi:hypothetical protein
LQDPPGVLLVDPGLLPNLIKWGSVKYCIIIDYSLSSVDSATMPGWKGKRVAELPKEVLSLAVLESDYKMKRFASDVCASLF